MLAITTLGYPPLLAALKERGLPAAVVVLIFALVAHRLRGVDLSGAIAGAVLSFLLYLTAGAEAFIAVAVVFCLTALSTRLGYGSKHGTGRAEQRQGRRWHQVLANLTVATATAVASLYLDRNLMLLATMGALAEAAADTVAGEVGQAYGGTVYLISNFKKVRSGTDGGISVVGTLAGAVAALLVALAGYGVELLPGTWVAVTAAAGLLGMLVDALAGATFQRWGWVSNDGANWLGTAAGAAIALLLTL